MYINSCNSCITCYNLGITIIIFILQMIKLRHRRVKWLAQGYTANYTGKAQDVLGTQVRVFIPTLGIRETSCRRTPDPNLEECGKEPAWRILHKGYRMHTMWVYKGNLLAFLPHLGFTGFKAHDRWFNQSLRHRLGLGEVAMEWWKRPGIITSTWQINNPHFAEAQRVGELSKVVWLVNGGERI